VNAVMNLWTYKMRGMSWIGEEVFMFSRRSLLRIGIYMCYQCYIVTSEMKDSDTHTIFSSCVHLCTS
jgi:hypothetical protein